jgi:polyhydroxybutyrate depolymerase
MRHDGRTLRRPLAPVLAAALLAWAAALIAAPAPARAGTWLEEQTLEHDGLTRYYRVFVPEGAAPSMPMVLLLHGGGGDYASLTENGPDEEWPEIAEEEGILLVVPNGFDPNTGSTGGDDQRWNDCRGDMRSRSSDADDVGFFDALIDWAIDNYDIDTQRVYATGASNGGMMSFRAAFELGDRVAAVAAFIANLPAASECSTPVDIVPTAIINGDAEEFYMPWEGGCVASAECAAGTVLSAEASRDWWLTHNLVDDPEPEVTEHPDINPNDDSTVTSWLHEGGLQGSAVEFYRVFNGGHAKPSIEHPYNPLVLRLLGLGIQNRDIESARRAWAFLAQHTLDGPPPASSHPGGAAYLRVETSPEGAALDLRWTSDCGAAERYGVYRGDLELGYDSLEPVPGLCDVAALGARVTPRPGVSEFFLAVPNDGSSEGDYGSGSSEKRPPALDACHPQGLIDTCAAAL